MIQLDVFFRGEKIFSKKSVSKEWLDTYRNKFKSLVGNLKDLKFVWKLPE